MLQLNLPLLNQTRVSVLPYGLLSTSHFRLLENRAPFEPDMAAKALNPRLSGLKVHWRLRNVLLGRLAPRVYLAIPFLRFKFPLSIVSEIKLPKEKQAAWNHIHSPCHICRRVHPPSFFNRPRPLSIKRNLGPISDHFWTCFVKSWASTTNVM